MSDSSSEQHQQRESPKPIDKPTSLANTTEAPTPVGKQKYEHDCCDDDNYDEDIDGYGDFSVNNSTGGGGGVSNGASQKRTVTRYEKRGGGGSAHVYSSKHVRATEAQKAKPHK